MNHGEIEFFTVTCLNWQTLLKEDKHKQIILNSLTFLVKDERIWLYAYVIMPNHIHIIWKSLNKNGKESTQGSFLKYTAHEFKKYITSKPSVLDSYKVNKTNKAYEFWQRDALSIELFSKVVMNQKMDYIHNNPLQEKWKLAETPDGYRFSSARFYFTGYDEFNFITHIGDSW